MKKGLIQIGLFDEDVCEVQDAGVRYILRRNPVRADEIAKRRWSKKSCVEGFLKKKNLYLGDHPRAKISTAIKDVKEKIKCLKINNWLEVKAQGGILRLEQDDTALKEESLLDGCYVIKTDLPQKAADKQIVHDRYKDLAEVEKAFRDCKTVLLEVRPVFVRTEKSTRGHVLVVMLAYMIIRKLRHAWAGFDLTVEEGLKQLSTLCSIEMKVKDHGSCLKIPRPRKKSRELLKALDISMPIVLPHREVRVVTRKKTNRTAQKTLKHRALRLVHIS
jgi:hypothetical protein